MNDKVRAYREDNRRCVFCQYYTDTDKTWVFWGSYSFCMAKKTYLQRNEADTCELYEVAEEEI